MSPLYSRPRRHPRRWSLSLGIKALNAGSSWFSWTNRYRLTGLFRKFDIWYCLSRFWSVFSSILTPRISDRIFNWWRSAAFWAHSSCLTCCPICLVASHLFVLPYSCFTSWWASSPCSRWASAFGLSAEEQMCYKLSWEGICTANLMYSLHVVTEKMKFCCWQVHHP